VHRLASDLSLVGCWVNRYGFLSGRSPEPGIHSRVLSFTRKNTFCDFFELVDTSMILQYYCVALAVRCLLRSSCENGLQLLSEFRETWKLPCMTGMLTCRVRSSEVDHCKNPICQTSRFQLKSYMYLMYLIKPIYSQGAVMVCSTHQLNTYHQLTALYHKRQRCRAERSKSC
jgi:hypothetical protein